MASSTALLEAMIRRDRLVLLAGMLVVSALAWGWLVLGAGMDMSAIEMTRMTGMDGWMMQQAVWTPAYALLIVSMWWVMMVAMMLPGAAPMLLLFTRVSRAQRIGDRPYVSTAIFAAGYLLTWGGFSTLATALQWGLEQLGLLSPMMTTTSYWLGGAILIAAGVWQLTPIKDICLRHCRSPLGFLVQGWRPGWLGALRMGVAHGTYCLGCCWFLMGLLFFGGIMNLFWITGLAGFILLEKTIPMGHWIGRIAGVGIVSWGVLMLASTTLTSAAPSDYRFEVVEVRVAEPGKTTVGIRLVHVPDKKLVESAVMLEAKTDMGPAGMAEMYGKVTPLPSVQPGIYRFLSETGMAGKWELILRAQVQGEADTVSGVITYDATK